MNDFYNQLPLYTPKTRRSTVIFVNLITGTETVHIKHSWTNRDIRLLTNRSKALTWCWIDKLEYIVEDEIGSRFGHKLKHLWIAHRPLFFIHLWNVRSGCPWGSVAFFTYQQCARDHDQNTARFIGWLCVERGDLMLDLTEGESLQLVSKLPQGSELNLTESFSIIPATPWMEVVSKVSIEWSRYRNHEHSSHLFIEALRPVHT